MKKDKSLIDINGAKKFNKFQDKRTRNFGIYLLSI